MSNYFVNKWNPDCSNYMCTTIMVHMEVMMWAIKRELILVEVDTGKSLLHRAKLRYFVVPIFWWLVLWTKLFLFETEGPFPNNFHPHEQFICFQQDNPSFYHRILTNVSVAELCKYMCGIVYIISHCLQMWFITCLFLSSETIRICSIIVNNSQNNPSTFLT